MKSNRVTEIVRYRTMAESNGRVSPALEFTATKGYRVYHAGCERIRVDRWLWSKGKGTSVLGVFM